MLKFSEWAAHVRRIGAALGLVVLLYVVEGMSLSRIAPLAVIFLGIAISRSVDDEVALEPGYKSVLVGVPFILAGLYYILEAVLPVGGAASLIGLWFVLDGVTAVRYSDNQASSTDSTAYDVGSDEAWLRIHTAGTVYRTLAENGEPQTPTDLAAELTLTESRVTAALASLKASGHVERDGDGYRAVPNRWGTMTPPARLAGWLLDRLTRPVRRLL